MLILIQKPITSTATAVSTTIGPIDIAGDTDSDEENVRNSGLTADAGETLIFNRSLRPQMLLKRLLASGQWVMLPFKLPQRGSLSPAISTPIL